MRSSWPAEPRRWRARRSVDLPDGLTLWSLAGGRPDVAAVPGEPEELGRLLEASFDPAERRRRGAHFTPSALANELIERAVAGHDRPTIGDPACGGGALLLAAARHLASAGEVPSQIVDRLWGADIDPLSVATTEAALTLWAGTAPSAGRLTVADALLDDLAWPRARRGRRQPALPHAARHPDRPHGRATPSACAGGSAPPCARTPTARDCSCCAVRSSPALAGRWPWCSRSRCWPPATPTGVRDAIGALGRLVDVFVPTRAGFDAAVEVCVPVIEVGGPRGSASAMERAPRRRPRRARRRPARVRSRSRTKRPRPPGSEPSTTAWSTTSTSSATCPTGRPFVTTGLIDLGHCAWGTRAARVGGRAWDRPVVDVGALEGRAADWAQRTGGPKLLVATQTRVVEVVVDDAGEWIAGVPLVVVLAPAERLWPLAAALAAPAVSAWLLQRAAGTARTPRALKVTAAAAARGPAAHRSRRLGVRHGGVPSAETSRGSRRRCPAPTARDRTWRRGGSSGRERSGVRRERAGRISPTSGVARATGSSNLGRTPKVLSHPSGWGCGPGDRATKCSGLDPPRVCPARRRRTGGRSAVG